MIEASGLSKFYSGHPAIDQVSFSIKQGEIVGLLGLNGAGKSTILKILGCFLLPSTGTARVAGFEVEQNPHAIRSLIGYLPDTPPLYDEMTVAAYLRFVGQLKNVDSSALSRRVAAVMDQTNLNDVASVRLSELSHGYRQRVGISQALVHDPKVLILDEPINGLDPVQIVEMRDLILSLRGKYTVILSSHILSEITRTCDRILVIDKGRLVAEGAESDLERRLSTSMRLTCEIDPATTDKLTAINQAIRALPGVSKLDEQRTGSGLKVVIESTTDVRAAVARAVVNGGGGLLAMVREDAGLEGLFMKLVRTAATGRDSAAVPKNHAGVE